MEWNVKSGNPAFHPSIGEVIAGKYKEIIIWGMNVCDLPPAVKRAKPFLLAEIKKLDLYFESTAARDFFSILLLELNSLLHV